MNNYNEVGSAALVALLKLKLFQLLKLEVDNPGITIAGLDALIGEAKVTLHGDHVSYVEEKIKEYKQLKSKEATKC